MMRLDPSLLNLLFLQVYVIEGQGGEAPKVQTDGINFIGSWSNADIIDVNKIITNDVAAMLNTWVEGIRGGH